MRDSTESPSGPILDPDTVPEPEKPSKLEALFKRLQGYSDRWWYLPLMGFLIFLDLFVVVIPSEGLLVKTVLLKPSRWIIAPALLVLCSALGAITLSYLVQTLGEPFIHWLVGEAALQSESWLKTKSFISEHGAIAMALMSLGPLPQQPAVVLCGLAQMDYSALFWAVLIGRAPKYFLFAYIARKLPHLYKTKLKRFLES